MCYGHPHHHPCGHQSVKWHYCPRAKIDVTTGHATICNKTTYAISQPSKTRCPLKNCYFKELGGVWDCCVCHQGPNTQGWCTYANPSWKKNFQKEEYEWVETCDHGCCKNCTRSESAGPMPEDDSKKKKKARKPSSSAAGSSSSPSEPHESTEGYGSCEYSEYGYERYGGCGDEPCDTRYYDRESKKVLHHGKGKGKGKGK